MNLRRLAIVACLIAMALIWGWWFFSRKTSSARPEPVAVLPPVSRPPAPASPTVAPVVPPSVSGGEKIDDFRTALEGARALRDPSLRSREFGRILRLWLERDENGVLAYLRQLPVTSDGYTQGILMLIESIAQRDPAWALALARELAVTREQLAIYSSLFAQFAQQNLRTATEHLTLVPPGGARENAIRALIDVWVRSDLPQASAWAQSLSESSDRATALEVVLTEMATKDPLQAIDLAQKSLTGPALERTVFNALLKLTETDAQGAAELVSLLPAGEMQTLAAVEVARALADQNVEAALAWAKTLPGDTVRRLAMIRALNIWSARDPAAASHYVAALPAGQDQHDLAMVVGGALAATNPQGAVAWAQSLPAAELRRVTLAAIADTWAQHDPAAATSWLALQPPDTLSTLAPQTLNAALSYWILRDAGAAQDFVRALPAAAQAGAAEFVAPLLSQNDPTGTLAWAQSLSNPPAREGALAAAYGRWLHNAPSAATAWLATVNLSPETKTRLQSMR